MNYIINPKDVKLKTSYNVGVMSHITVAEIELLTGKYSFEACKSDKLESMQAAINGLNARVEAALFIDAIPAENIIKE